MKVYKFGGTSVGSPERMRHVAGLVTRDAEPKLVVLSAVSGTTNKLEQICLQLMNDKSKAALQVQQLNQEYLDFVEELLPASQFNEKARDVLDEHFNLLRILTGVPYVEPLTKVILAQGELLSTKLFALYLEQEGIDHRLLNALDILEIDGNGEPVMDKLGNSLSAELTNPAQVNIIQGYICKNVRGEIDNLRRGGSDYSATLFGAAIKAEEVQIWTDIDGMHNNDPRVVDRTFPLSRLNFEEASELAYFGAKILHPLSIFPAQKAAIPVRLLNTLDPESAGTLVSHESVDETIKAIAVKDNIIAIKIKSGRMFMAYGFLRKVFEVFEKYRTPIDVITTSEVAVSLTIDSEENLAGISRELEDFGKVIIDRDQSIICIVGSMVSERKGIVRKIFDVLEDIPIRMISYGGSKNNITLVIDTRHKGEALKSLNEGLFSDHWK